MAKTLCQTLIRIAGLVAVCLLPAGGAQAAEGSPEAMQFVEGNVRYREPMALPPDAVIRIYLEDVARMDVPSKVIAATVLRPEGGQPWHFTLPYDPGKLQEQGRYALRVRIEAADRLLFINTETVPAFEGDRGVPVQVLVSQVGEAPAGRDAPAGGDDLMDTRWRLIEVDGQQADPGAGGQDVYIVFASGDQRANGFAGCNRFLGGYEREGDRLRLTQLISTRKACIDAMDQEQRFLALLEQAMRFTIADGTLSLYSGDERPILRFEAAAP